MASQAESSGNEGRPDVMHVSEPLTDNNYADWSREVMKFLISRNKVGYVDGSIKKQEIDAIDFEDCDTMIKRWLTTAMDEAIRTRVQHTDTASEIWTNLKDWFGKESAYKLKKTLSMTRQNGGTVSGYYTELLSLWIMIEFVLPLPECSCNSCTCDVGKKLSELKEKERLYEFLMGLDEHFFAIITDILARKSILSVEDAKNLVALEEEYLKAKSADQKSGKAPKTTRPKIKSKMEKDIDLGKWI